MVASLKLGYVEPKDLEKKAEIYAVIHGLADQFKSECGSIICRELLGIKDDGSTVPSARTAEYYKERPCVRCVRTAAEIIEKRLEK